MAEESIETPLIPEITEAEHGLQRRRNSTEKLDSPNGEVKILSRYLRASPSSCHDVCKFGTKHEAKTRSSFPKMVTAKGGERLVLEKAVTSIERKKKSAISPKPSSDSRVQKPSNHVVIKGEVSSSTKNEIASLEKVLTPLKEIGVAVEHASNQKLKPMQSKQFSHPAEGSLSIQRINEIRISNELQGDSDRSRKSKIISKELRTSKMGEKNVCIPHTVYLFPKHSVKRVSSMNTKNENRVVKVKPKQPVNEDVPEKTLYVIEASTENKTVEPSQNGVHIINSSPSSSQSLVDKSLKHARKGILSSRLPPSSKKNNLRHTGTGFNATLSPPSSSLSIGNKSLTHIRRGTLRAKSSLSPSEPSHSKQHGAKTGSEDQIASAKVEYRSRPRRDGMVSSEIIVSPARKLKFRRGKVVEVQSENSTPRRLKFRRVRLLGEIQNGKDHTRKSSIRRKEVDDGELSSSKLKSDKDFQTHKNVEGTRRRSSKKKEVGDSENDSKIEPEEVVLRHPNVEGKKDTQSLYNNVIEETASKLVMTRKSKVKALVGAFETVISLQDSRPSVTTDAC